MSEVSATPAFSLAWIAARSRWVAKYKRLDGTWPSKYIPSEAAPTDRDREPAVRWLVAWLRNPKAKIVVPEPPAVKTTASEWNSWLEARYANPKVKGAMCAQNLSHGTLYILPHPLAQLPLADWRPEHAKEFVVWVRDTLKGAKTGKPLSPCAQGNLITSYSAFLSAQAEVAANPFHHKMVKAEQPARRTAWDQGEPPHIESVNVPRFLGCEHESIPMWRRVKNALAILGGCREGELQGLRWKNVDLAHAIKHYLIAEQLTACAKDGSGGLMIGPDSVKTLSSFRVVPLHPYAAKRLQAWFETGWAQYVGREPEADDYVFPSESGRPFLPLCALQLRQDCLAAGIPTTYRGHELTMHATRRTFSTLLADAGVPDVVVDSVLGHATGSVAAANYIKKNLAPQAETISKIQLKFAAKRVKEAAPSGFAAMQAAKRAKAKKTPFQSA